MMENERIDPHLRAKTRTELEQEYRGARKGYNNLIQTYIVFGMQIREISPRVRDSLSEIEEKLEDMSQRAILFRLPRINGEIIDLRLKIQRVLA